MQQNSWQINANDEKQKNNIILLKGFKEKLKSDLVVLFVPLCRSLGTDIYIKKTSMLEKINISSTTHT